MSRESYIAEQAKKRRDRNKNKKNENKNKNTSSINAGGKGIGNTRLTNSKQSRAAGLQIKNALKSAGDKLKEFGKDRVDEFKTRSGIKSSTKSTDKPKSGTDLASLKKKLKRHAGGRSSVAKTKLKLKIRKLEANKNKKGG